MKLRVRLFGKNGFSVKNKYIEKINKGDYYFIYVICKNCGQTMSVAIKKGVHLNDVITGIKCDFCEVRLNKQEKI